jgi:RNA polymerase sigma factor for flagellar operon FliA
VTQSGLSQTERPGDLQRELWEQYKRTGDQKIRDRLVLTFAPMVKYIVHRKLAELPNSVDADDFIACGIVAMIAGIDRWEPEKGAGLEQYLWTRIHGAVLDELRSRDWAPRSVRRTEREIKRARQTFHAIYHRQPSDDELADAIGITVADVHAHYADIHRAEVASLNTPVQTEDATTVERVDVIQSEDSDVDPERHAVQADLQERVAAAVRALPERERLVAIMLYEQEMTLREAGQILGVTEGRVSQMRGDVLRKLRRWVEQGIPQPA